MRRPALPSFLLALAASLLAAPVAHADLQLPAGAEAPPQLAPGVVPASVPPISVAAGQDRSVLGSMSAARKVFQLQEGPQPLWATVNICDTGKSPDALGLRTSVPGDGSRRFVYARYRAQWWSRAKQAWLPVAGAGKSDWNFVGKQNWRAHQGGWTFHFSQPPAGTTYVVRGIVELSWRDQVHSSRHRRKRARWSVVQRKALLTETGKSGVQGGDPAGTSKAMCLIW